MGVIFVSSIIFVPVWIYFSNKLGARGALMMSLICTGVSLIFFMVANSLAIAAVTGGILGFGLAGLLLLPDVIMSQVIDEDEVKTGMRREGAYYGVNAFIMRFSVALEAIILTSTLKLSGYNNTLVIQPSGAVLGIRALMSIIPILSLVVAFIFMYFYPLHGKRLNDVNERIVSMGR